MRKLVLLLIVGFLSTLATPASATAPETHTIDQSFTGTFDEICSFPIRFHLSLTGTETLYFDAQGDVTRDLSNLEYKGFWSHSGNRLIEHDRLLNIAYPNGDVAVIGLNWHLRLPDGGTVLIDAGKLVFDSTGEIVFKAGKHQFEDGDFGAICAALR